MPGMFWQLISTATYQYSSGLQLKVVSSVYSSLPNLSTITLTLLSWFVFPLQELSWSISISYLVFSLSPSLECNPSLWVCLFLSQLYHQEQCQAKSRYLINICVWTSKELILSHRLWEEGITVYFINLSNEVFGCLTFADQTASRSDSPAVHGGFLTGIAP